MEPVMVGTTSYYSKADNFRRTYCVWAVGDVTTLELDSIYINNSSDFTCAAGPLLRKDCKLPYQLQAWTFAEQQLRASLIKDTPDAFDEEAGMVIEPFDAGDDTTQPMYRH